MSQPSISRCLHRVTDAINENIFRQWVQFPMTLQARQFAKEQFRNAPQSFEGVIGAIDCTHVAVIAPREHEEAYINHNGYHSINVQMVPTAIIYQFFLSIYCVIIILISFIILDMRPESQDPEREC